MLTSPKRSWTPEVSYEASETLPSLSPLIEIAGLGTFLAVFQPDLQTALTSSY